MTTAVYASCLGRSDKTEPAVVQFGVATVNTRRHVWIACECVLTNDDGYVNIDVRETCAEDAPVTGPYQRAFSHVEPEESLVLTGLLRDLILGKIAYVKYCTDVRRWILKQLERENAERVQDE